MDSTALAITLAVFGLLLIAISYQRHRHHRDRSALLHGLTGAAFCAGAALLFEFALDLHSYQDLQSDTPLAEISFTRNGKVWQANLMRIPSGELQVYTFIGSQWTMEARLLHWRRLMPWFGLTEQLRLEALLSDDAKNSGAPVGRYALSHDAGINLWRWGETQNSKDPWLVTETISSLPQSLQDGQRFHVYLHAGQLLVRQINRVYQTEPTAPPLTPALNDKAVTLLKNSALTVQGAGTGSVIASSARSAPPATSPSTAVTAKKGSQP
jgi:hypothetical protein